MTYPAFNSGEVLTASDMNAVGLWLVKTQTIGTGVASVTVNGAFSANYDNYLIMVTGGGTTAGDYGINMRLGGTVGGYYYYGEYINYANTFANAINGAGVAEWGAVGIASTTNLMARVNVHSPFQTKPTYFSADYTYNNPGGGRANMAGYLNDSNSYTDFTLFINASTFSGGTIRVYGYRN
jgi:hypothetical protein